MSRDEQGHKNRNETDRQGHSQRRIRWPRVVGLLLSLLIVVAALYGYNQMYGGIHLNSSDISSTSSDDQATTTDTSQTTTTAQTQATTIAQTTTAAPTQTTTEVTTSSTTVVNVEGHYVQSDGADWNLKLVNPWNPIDSSYSVPLTTYAGVNQFDSRAMDELRAMIEAGSAYNLSVASVYRSIELQTKLFNNQVAKWTAQGYSEAEAEDKAATVVARPGTSEHNLGLATDILGSGYSSLEESFENTDAFAWLESHCAEYGFILRYLKGKEDVTGVTYEPWHYRYVGVEVATEIMSRGITLEEYLQELGE
jgi:D-alanyl-D-alanine carboxypeptidase